MNLGDMGRGHSDSHIEPKGIFAHKHYRLYFNRKNEFPQVWSIDEGDQSSEVNVQWFSLLGINAVSIYNGKEANDDTPVAWIAVKGIAEFRDGGVVIR